MGHHIRVFEALCAQEWCSEQELIAVTGTSAATAYLRDLRKPQWGGFHIEGRRDPDGIYRFHLDRADLVPERICLVAHPKPHLAWKNAAAVSRPVLATLINVAAQRRVGTVRNTARLAVLNALVQHGYLEPDDLREWLRLYPLAPRAPLAERG